MLKTVGTAAPNQLTLLAIVSKSEYKRLIGDTFVVKMQRVV